MPRSCLTVENKIHELRGHVLLLLFSFYSSDVCMKAVHHVDNEIIFD